MEDKKPELKVFELRWTSQGEREWVCAYSNVHALKFYCGETSTSLQDMHQLDEIIELPKERWSDYFIKNIEHDRTDPDDWEQKSFAEYMKTQTHPDIIATTIY